MDNVTRSSARAARTPKAWSRGRTLALVAPLCAVGLLLQACGDSTPQGASEPDDSGSNSTTQTDQPAERHSVRFISNPPTLSVANMLAGMALGYFEDEGLDIELLPPVPTTAATVQAIDSGHADMGWSGSTVVVAAVQGGRDIVSVATTTVGSPHAVSLNADVVERLAAEGVTPESPLEDRIQALRGLELAGSNPGDPESLMLPKALGKYGLTVGSDVRVPSAGFHDERAAAARQGVFDGYIATAPFSAIAESQGWGSLWFSLDEVPEVSELPFVELATTRKYVEENPEVIKAFLRGLWRVRDAFENEPQMVADALKEAYFTDMDADLFQTAFDAVVPLYLKSPVPTEQQFEAFLEDFNAAAEEDFEGVFADVYDDSYALATAP